MPSARIDPDPSAELAKGSERHIYALTDTPDSLLKVMKSKHLREVEGLDDRKLVNWLRIRRAYSLFRREQRAWTNAMLRAAVRDELPPLAGVGDFVVTPGGLGQLVEHVRSPDASTAPTLHNLAVEAEISDIHLEALNTFVTALYDWHIPAYDLGPKNIVWQEEQARFVLVDGFGDRALIPLVTWFRIANDWQLDRSFEKTANRSPLHWDRKTRSFSRGAP